MRLEQCIGRVLTAEGAEHHHNQTRQFCCSLGDATEYVQLSLIGSLCLCTCLYHHQSRIGGMINSAEEILE